MQEIIYVQMAGVELGPFTEKKVRQYLTDGDLLLADLARLDPKAEWAPLSEVLQKLPSSEPELPAVAAVLEIVAESPKPPEGLTPQTVEKTAAPESFATVISAPPKPSVTPPPLPAAKTPPPVEDKAPANPMSSVSTQWSWVAAFAPAPSAPASKTEEPPAKVVAVEPVPEKKTAPPKIAAKPATVERTEPISKPLVEPSIKGTGSLVSVRAKLSELLVGKLPAKELPREQKEPKSQPPEPTKAVAPAVVEKVTPIQEDASVKVPPLEKDKISEKTPIVPVQTHALPLVSKEPVGTSPLVTDKSSEKAPVVPVQTHALPLVPKEFVETPPSVEYKNSEKAPVVPVQTHALPLVPKESSKAFLPGPVGKTEDIVSDAVTPSDSDPAKWLWIPPVVSPQSASPGSMKKTESDLKDPSTGEVAVETPTKLNPRSQSQLRPFKAKFVVPEPGLTPGHVFKMGDRNERNQWLYAGVGLALLLAMVAAVEWDVVSSGLSGVWSTINFYLYQVVTLFSHKI